MAKKIEEWEIQRYWDIFSPLTNRGQYLNGAQAASVLKNSGLSEDQLAKVWDLSDVDGDGALDFEEFCVAMRLSFDVVNGEYATIPSSLPDWLVPSSKTHLVQATRALSTGDRFERPDSDSDDEGIGLKDGFDWYMPPGDKSKYEAIYNANSNSAGDITFTSLSALYSSLDVPDTDVRSAWNLVNPSANASIGKDATLAFLHILNNRHEGYRIPRRVPDSLRASFERGNVDFKLDKVQNRDESRGKSYAERYDEKTSSGRKAKFGDTYLSRMGLGGGGNAYSSAKGTDFSEDAQWEEVRLKKELAELDKKIEQMESRAKERKSATRGSQAAVVRRELEQMLDYKRETLRALDEKGENGESGKEEQSFDAIMKDIDEVKAQIGNLEDHYNTRVAVLEGLREQIEELQGKRR